jgi:hypothetical protein
MVIDRIECTRDYSQVCEDRSMRPFTAQVAQAAVDANGASHPEPSSYARKFSGRYAHPNIERGIGHNLPQEAPRAFAKAVIDVDGY